ncbi:MAG: CoA pyrophosphatase [Candidatus Promineifilaceae bacterium]
MKVISPINQIQQALYLKDFDPVAAQMKMAPRPRATVRTPETPGQVRQGGVLILLYEVMGQSHLVLTRRRDDLSSHAGQVSFPGGRREPGETLQTTAFRETYEEIGVYPGELDLLGYLATIYIPPTDYEVHPFVAWHRNGRPRFISQETEVAEILEVPLSLLLDPATRQEELWEIRGFQLTVPFYLVEGHKVWGATAMILSEFLERLRQL